VNGSGLLESLARLLEQNGIDLAAWGLAWARVAPLLAVVPAYGCRESTQPERAAAALLLALVIVPAMRPIANETAPFPVLLLTELARGTVVAVSAAVPLWAATMAGGVIDALRLRPARLAVIRRGRVIAETPRAVPTVQLAGETAEVTFHIKRRSTRSG